MIDYQIKKLLSRQELQYCNQYWDRSKKHYYDVWHNVINVNKVDIDLSDPGMNHIVNKLTFDGLNIKVSYMLEYYKDSFTQIHVDNGTNATSVTPINISNDFKGGYTILQDIINDRKCLVTLPSELGNTFVYNGSIGHGVSKVLSGTRRVLIVWYKP